MEEETNSINPVIAGKTIYLAPRIRKYGDLEDNFRIYKLSIMHEVGHAQFSSHKIERDEAARLMGDIRSRYTTIIKRTHFSGLQPEGIIDIAEIIALFPNKVLAGTILGILEDTRVEYRIMQHYRGVRSDL